MGGPLRLAACIPHWLALEREAAMQVDDRVIHCVAFLGEQSPIGFIAEGTCFFICIIEDELNFTYIVTAKHVIRPFADDRLATPNPNPIWIRVQRQSGPPRLIETTRSNWVCHSDRFIDIAVHPFDFARWDADDDLYVNTLAIPHIIMTPEIEDHFGFGLGREVFIPSVFVGRVGEKQNIPVVRVATIAAMPLEPIRGGSPRKPAYLIETKSLGGTSGAPVLFHSKPYRIFGRETFSVDQKTGSRITPYYLIGMVIGAHSGQYARDFTKDVDEAEIIVPKDADFNAGIAVVLPVSQILEVLEQDNLRVARALAKQASQDVSGFRPTK